MVFIAEKTFYKVIVLNVDVWESTIEDERHYHTQDEARAAAREFSKAGFKTVIVRM